MTYADEAPEASRQIKTCMDVYPVLTSQQSQLKQPDSQITKGTKHQPHLNESTTFTTHTDQSNTLHPFAYNSSDSSTGKTPKVKIVLPV